MAHSSARLKRYRALVALMVALPLALAGVTSPAYGDTQPPSGPATVSTDPLPTVQVNGVAWAQVDRRQHRLRRRFLHHCPAGRRRAGRSAPWRGPTSWPTT